jgi:hypothetical protein
MMNINLGKTKTSQNKDKIANKTILNMDSSPYNSKSACKFSKPVDNNSILVPKKSSIKISDSNILLAKDKLFMNLFAKGNHTSNKNKIGYSDIHGRAMDKSKLNTVIIV